MRLFLLLFSAILPPALGILCYDGLDISLYKAFSEDVYYRDFLYSNNTTVCQIDVIFDKAPNEVASVSMYAREVKQKNGTYCHLSSMQYPRTQKERDMNVKVYDYIRIRCICAKKKCNTPGLVMDYLGHSNHTTILEAMKSVWQKAVPRQLSDSTALRVMTGVVIGLIGLFLFANFVYMVIQFFNNSDKLSMYTLDGRNLSNETVDTRVSEKPASSQSHTPVS